MPIKDNVYISGDNLGICACCKREKDLRIGICWDCAVAECIVGDGVDMFDKTFPHAERIPYSEAMNRVKFLISKGWKPPEKE